jgi:catechol 2,3-dioxygenase-like lactoylglutathione lyase family enzyme
VDSYEIGSVAKRDLYSSRSVDSKTIMPLIHTCYRITDIDRSVAFYEALGFKEVGRIPIRDEAVNVFMNQPSDGDMPRLELTCNFGAEHYDLGTVAKLDLYSAA